MKEVGRRNPCFPACLTSISEPPEAVYLRGELPPSPRVALVGSRQADEYGLAIARRLGRELAQAGVCVVSGGAGGVDTAALEGCLEGNGRPVAVLGTGVDVAYPAANRALFERVAAQGALVSEYPPGTAGLRHHFPRRNRLISALSEGVVVVRAAIQSGSLITARAAVRQGRVLMAVPGPAGERLSAGAHWLIRRGAALVESGADILSRLGIEQVAQRPLALVEQTEAVGDREMALLRELHGGEASVDRLTVRTGWASAEVASLLLEMELQGLVVRKPGMVYGLASAIEPVQPRHQRDAGSILRRNNRVAGPPGHKKGVVSGQGLGD